VINIKDIGGCHSAEGHWNLQYTQLYNDFFYLISHIKCWLLPTLVHIASWRSDHHHRHCICFHWVGSSPRINALMTIRDHIITVLKQPLAKTVYLGNRTINFICHMHMVVTLLYSSHFQVILSSTTCLHWIWHPVHNQALGKPGMSELWASVARRWSLPRWLCRVLKCHPPAFLRTRALSSRGTMRTPSAARINPVTLWTSFSATPPQPPAVNMGDPPLPSNWKDCSLQLNCAKLMS